MTIEDLMREHAAFDEAVGRLVKGMIPAEMTHDSTGLCVMAFRVERADVIRLLARAAHEAKLTARVDFSQAHDGQLQTAWDIRACGLLPPAAGDAVDVATTPVRLPDGWPGGYLEASGRAEAPARVMSPPERQAWAERIARVEAGRRLWLQVEALSWEGASVGHLITSHPRGQRIVESVNQLIEQVPTAMGQGDGGAGAVEVHLRVSLPMVAETLRTFESDE
jgi:hypothetical protein